MNWLKNVIRPKLRQLVGVDKKRFQKIFGRNVKPAVR